VTRLPFRARSDNKTVSSEIVGGGLHSAELHQEVINASTVRSEIVCG